MMSMCWRDRQDVGAWGSRQTHLTHGQNFYILMCYCFVGYVMYPCGLPYKPVAGQEHSILTVCESHSLNFVMNRNNWIQISNP